MFSNLGYYLERPQKYMKKKILVPTDFSANALSAAHYACQIAAQNNYDIRLFHCYTTSTVDTADTQIQELKSTLLNDNNPIIISDNVASFGATSDFSRIFYVTEDRDLYTVNIDGSDKKKLDENERASITRLMKVKSMIADKND